MKCPICSNEIGVTIGTPNFEGAYSELKKIKAVLDAMANGDLKTTLTGHVEKTMKLLDAPTSVSLYRPDRC